MKRLPNEHYFLLGEWTGGEFVVVEVPNRSLLDNMDSFDTKHGRRIRLHLAAYEGNWLVDERVTDGLCFRSFEWQGGHRPPSFGMAFEKVTEKGKSFDGKDV
jgi:hypothetical protein